ncbi:MAG: hypothetical protein WCL18_03560 [bacterium]
MIIWANSDVFTRKEQGNLLGMNTFIIDNKNIEHPKVYYDYKRYSQKTIREKQIIFWIIIIFEYFSFIVLGNNKVRMIPYIKTKTG